MEPCTVCHVGRACATGLGLGRTSPHGTWCSWSDSDPAPNQGAKPCTKGWQTRFSTIATASGAAAGLPALPASPEVLPACSSAAPPWPSHCPPGQDPRTLRGGRRASDGPVRRLPGVPGPALIAPPWSSRSAPRLAERRRAVGMLCPSEPLPPPRLGPRSSPRSAGTPHPQEAPASSGSVRRAVSRVRPARDSRASNPCGNA